MNSRAVRFVFLTVVIGAAGAFIGWDAQRGVEGEQVAGRAPATDAPPVVQRTERAQHEPEWRKSEPQKPEPGGELPRLEVPRNGLFRCDQDGKTVYQGEPCERGQKQREVAGGTVNVVAASRPASRPRATMANDPAPESGASFGRIAAPRFDLVDHERCAVLRSEIERLDALARYRSTEGLRERRRVLVREMDDRRCETWPS